MFEKEAEEWVKSQMVHCIQEQVPYFDFAIQAFLAGLEYNKQIAELNKANEWHYPSKGEYSKECEDVLCYCADIKSCSIGHTIIGGDNKIRWWSSNRSEELKVYAWKEITPPKFEE